MDIPVCPKCGEKPEYWYLYTSGKTAAWLLSDGYAASTRLNKVKLFSTEFCDMDAVKCWRTHWYYLDSPVAKQVIEYMRYFNNERYG